MSSRRSKRSGAVSPRGLEQRVLRRWRTLGRPELNSIIVGFSAGPDSLALAACLARLRPLLGADVRLLHVDHGLRPTSALDAIRARALAGELGLDFTTACIDEERLASHSGVGVEEAARRERYQIFSDVVAGNDHAILTLGHHEMDQAETVLLHLLRGCGLRGASGMAELSEIKVPWWTTSDNPNPRSLRIWRPFLSERRDVVRDYIRSLALEPIEDETNQAVQFRRNALRHEVLPVMERIIPGSTGAFGRFAALAAEDDRYLDEQAEILLVEAHREESGLSIDALAKSPLALRRRAIFQWLTDLGALEPTLDRVDAVLQLIQLPRTPAVIELGGSYRAHISGGCLVVERS